MQHDLHLSLPVAGGLQANATDAASELDTGWTGIAHNATVIGQGKVTVSASCPGTPGACGTCTYTGPVPNL